MKIDVDRSGHPFYIHSHDDASLHSGPARRTLQTVRVSRTGDQQQRAVRPSVGAALVRRDDRLVPSHCVCGFCGAQYDCVPVAVRMDTALPQVVQLGLLVGFVLARKCQ
jgi:hypothetical protein